MPPEIPHISASLISCGVLGGTLSFWTITTNSITLLSSGRSLAVMEFTWFVGNDLFNLLMTSPSKANRVPTVGSALICAPKLFVSWSFVSVTVMVGIGHLSLLSTDAASEAAYPNSVRPESDDVQLDWGSLDFANRHVRAIGSARKRTAASGYATGFGGARLQQAQQDVRRRVEALKR